MFNTYALKSVKAVGIYTFEVVLPSRGGHTHASLFKMLKYDIVQIQPKSKKRYPGPFSEGKKFSKSAMVE